MGGSAGMPCDEGCATSHRFKWGPFSPNEVGRIAQHFRKGEGRKGEYNLVPFIKTNASPFYAAAPYVKQCKLGDPALVTCIIGALHHLRPYLAQGKISNRVLTCSLYVVLIDSLHYARTCSTYLSF